MFEQIRQYYSNTLHGLQPEEWEALREKLTVQHLKKGEFLTRRGEICRHVSFINSGLLRLYYMIDGREVATGFMAENSYIASYDSFLLQQPSIANLDALEDCELINLSYNSMQELYQRFPVFERFGRKIAEMLFVLLSSQTGALLTLAPEERYLHVLETQPFIIQRVPQYMIASFIGITPEHLSRLRKKMMKV